MHFCKLTRTHDHQVARGYRVTAGGADMSCGVDGAEIWVPHEVEMFGGKTACAVAIDHHKATEWN